MDEFMFGIPKPNTLELNWKLSDSVTNAIKDIVLKNTAPTLSHIDVNDGATVVHWDDGTVTTVRLCPGEQTNVYTAFCAALAKKIYGSTNAVHKEVDKHMVEYINKQREEERLRNVAEQKEREERNHRRKIKALTKRLKNLQEALDVLTGEENDTNA